eukprot:CAMPEP_0177506184 /NCGR_PEP_ID=MMETSP0369-20130122/39813_1 /TAXON_ID=447022 ORGANISM="Scrippsiella hangoei-like, Strain SHHI-4" /NCGR_SAMPLE_ID=MMETSP0369 /ASSEMBLY_ACC=CAM_ASM_000364 /LENGTH=77 /DNA_ID=CAMNT_0018984121 /DNA_START=376 /DNA_END=609 /DNA_ORIENTATION=-
MTWLVLVAEATQMLARQCRHLRTEHIPDHAELQVCHRPAHSIPLCSLSKAALRQLGQFWRQQCYDGFCSGAAVKSRL